MIELKFYRDDEYVYINNPDGTTKRVAIEDFEAMFDVDTSELPAYTSSDAGKVLVVNNDGTGLEWGESGIEHKTITATLANNFTALANSNNFILADMLSFKDDDGNVVEPQQNYIISSINRITGLVVASFTSAPVSVSFQNITASDITLNAGRLICTLVEI